MRVLHINGMTPSALAIAIALEEKRLDYEIAAHDWRETPAALGAFGDSIELLNSLEGEFPILVDGDVAVGDSYFVLEYLDDRYPDPPLRPDDAYGQWQLQALARFFGERALPAVATLGVAQRSAGDIPGEMIAGFRDASLLTSERRDAWTSALEQPQPASLIEESRRKLALLFERIGKALADRDGPWLLGQRYTLSDIAAYALVHPFVTGSLDAGDIAIGQAILDWHDRVDSRPTIRRATALREPAYLPGPEHARWG